MINGSNSGVGSNNVIRHQQGQLVPSQQSQNVFHMNSIAPPVLAQHQLAQPSRHNQFGMPPPPPPPQISRPQINPLGVNFMHDGPISTLLKRDPGFGNSLLEEAMYDQAKQAQEMSSHFLLPFNNLHYSTYTPNSSNGNNNSQFNIHPESSNRNGEYNNGSGSSNRSGNSSYMGMPGFALQYSNRTPSGSSNGYPGVAEIYNSGASSSKTNSAQGKAAQPAAIPSNFDPAVLAQDLSSAYVSVISGIPTSNAASHDMAGQPSTPQTKSANALGKASASNTSLGVISESGEIDLATSVKMRELRRKIAHIISSVWADTVCGKSAGMAGITAADDEPSNECSYKAHDPQLAPGAQPNSHLGIDSALVGVPKSGQPMVSPSGDRSMDDHLINFFFDHVHHQLPIIPRSEFVMAYQQGTVSPMLICAMCAAASVFLNRIEDERKSIYNLYSQKVREQFHDACFEPSLEVVQTALIMMLCEYRHGSLHRAWVYL
ncbi:hypothetical protein GGF37_004802, partial [Kickxella alabastrina]